MDIKLLISRLDPRRIREYRELAPQLRCDENDLTVVCFSQKVASVVTRQAILPVDARIQQLCLRVGEHTEKRTRHISFWSPALQAVSGR